MNYFKLFVTVFFVFQSLYVDGQNTPVRFLPKDFKTFSRSDYITRLVGDKLNFERISNDVVKGIEWRVYSNNSSNKLFKSVDCNDENGSTLDFMQPLMVLDVVGNSLKVCDSETRKFLGWVTASQLILSDYALLNKNGLPRKALLITSLNDANSYLNESDLKVVSVYKNSQCTDKYSEASHDLWSIYYVISETSDAYLLSKVDVLNGNKKQIEDAILGWVKKFSVTAWDYRVCLEENYRDEKAVKDYAGKFIPIFRKKEKLEDYLGSAGAGNPSSDSESIIYDVILTDSMPYPRDPRFPILKNFDELSIRETIVVGTVGGGESNGKARKIIDDLIANLSNINVIFVIDATQSMTKFYKPVVDALSGFFDQWKLTRNINKLRVGCVLYRDYLDNPAFEVLPMTSDEKEVINYLNNITTMSINKLLPEAQFNGIINGVDKLGIDPNASNIFVIIGDAGNKENDKYNVEDVINKLKKYHGNIVSFQVNDGNHPTYRDFRSDMNAIVRGVCENIQNGYTYEKSQNIKNTYLLKPRTKSDYEHFYNIGRFSYASLNLSMDPNFLKESLLECLESHSLQVDNIKKSLSRGGRRVINDVAVKAMMQERKVPESVIRNAFKIQGSAKGFTFLRAYGFNTDVYSKVVYLSQSELNEVKNIFNKLIRSIQSSGTTMAKSAFKDAILVQCRRMTGETNNDILYDKSIGEIWEAILGIDFEGDYRIKDYPLRDLDKIDDAVFQKFVKKMENSASKFNNNDYKNRFFVENNSKFYYIPLEDFPGNKE